MIEWVDILGHAPVIAVALLLFFTAVIHGDRVRGLAAYCLAVAIWATSLLLVRIPETAAVGQHLVAVGSFVVASYLHAALEQASHANRWLALPAYGVAVIVTSLGAVAPQLLHAPDSLAPGPLFWPAMLIAGAVAAVPLGAVMLKREQHRLLWRLGVSGFLGCCGAGLHVLLVVFGHGVPIGLFLVLGSMLLLATVVRTRQTPETRRVLERSISYSAAAALLNGAYLTGALVISSTVGVDVVVGDALILFAVLATAALAFEPMQQYLSGRLARIVVGGSSSELTELARELVGHEKRSDQNARLAASKAETTTNPR